MSWEKHKQPFRLSFCQEEMKNTSPSACLCMCKCIHAAFKITLTYAMCVAAKLLLDERFDAGFPMSVFCLPKWPWLEFFHAQSEPDTFNLMYNYRVCVFLRRFLATNTNGKVNFNSRKRWEAFDQVVDRVHLQCWSIF